VDEKSRGNAIRVLSGVAVVGTILLCGLRCINMIEQERKNRDPEPFRELPNIYSRWENADGFILFGRTWANVDGRNANATFERGGAGQKTETGLGGSFDGKNEAPDGERASMLMFVLDGDKVVRRETIRYRVHLDTLQIWDEGGKNERIFGRKPKKY
jgi:hypothetical protein